MNDLEPHPLDAAAQKVKLPVHVVDLDALTEPEHEFRWMSTSMVPRGICSCGWLILCPDTEAQARTAWERHVREAQGGAA